MSNRSWPTPELLKSVTASSLRRRLPFEEDKKARVLLVREDDEHEGLPLVEEETEAHRRASDDETW